MTKPSQGRTTVQPVETDATYMYILLNGMELGIAFTNTSVFSR
jgi:hypothetical protein